MVGHYSVAQFLEKHFVIGMKAWILEIHGWYLISGLYGRSGGGPNLHGCTNLEKLANARKERVAASRSHRAYLQPKNQDPVPQHYQGIPLDLQISE